VAVYTTLSESQVNEMLARFQLPLLAHMEGAGDGIENTTYFLTLTNQHRLVLTLFEMLDTLQLPPYIQLMHHYHSHRLPVPCPLHDSAGSTLQYLANKPALLFPRASGKHITDPSVQQCALLGKTLAELHLAAVDFRVEIPNPCGLPWAERSASRIMPYLESGERRLLNDQLMLGRTLQSRQLPRGIIHGDLFKDNVLFEGNAISAIIDFYNAGIDILLLDLAIAVNDWCFDDAGHHLHHHQSALMDAYQLVRPLNQEEISAWPDCLQWAACRFWLSRLNATLRPLRQDTNLLKNPDQYRDLLLFYLSKRS